MSLSQSSNARNLSAQILNLEERLIRQTYDFGHRMRRSPGSLGSYLTSLPQSALEGLIQNLSKMVDILDTCVEENVDPFDDREFFRLSMREMKLSYPADFLKRIKSEDIIEAYDMNRHQIFRNMRFMEASSYSLTEMLSQEWPTLFERSSQITALIIKATEQDMWSANTIIDSNIPKHFIRELLSREPQVCEIQHKFFAPLFSGPNQPAGILSVCQGRVLSQLADVHIDNLTFI